MKRQASAIMAWPLAFAAAALAGLISGLVGEGLPDAFAWAALGIIPLTIAVAVLRRDRTNPRSGRPIR